MVNRKGSISTTLLVIMTFILVGSAFYSFYNNSKEVKAEIIDVYFMNKFYSSEFQIEKELYGLLENEIIVNYPSAINQGLPDDASKIIISHFKEKIKSYDLKEYQIKYLEGKFYFYSELNEPLTGCLDGSKSWRWGTFKNNDDCKVGVIYRPSIDFILDLNVIGLEKFENYNSAIEGCKNNKKIKECFESKLVNLEVSYVENDQKIVFRSRQFYFVNNKLEKIEFSKEFTQDL